MTRFLAYLALLLATALPASSVTAKVQLNTEDQAAVARAETYLNTMQSLKSRFSQDSTGGGYAQGMLYLRRPGRLRLDYEPPAKVQIYADGIWLIYVDTELEEVTHVPLGATLAGFLVRKNVKLSGKVTVTKVERKRGFLRVHLIQTDEPDAGQLVLNFSEAPFALRSWSVTDSQSVTTRVTLIGPEINPSIAKDVFEFDATKYDEPIND